MDVTFQRLDLLEIADRASTFRDSMLRLRTDANKLIVSATGREAAVDPISKVVADTLLAAVVSTPGTGNADPAELGKQARALGTVQARLVSLSVWPGFELSGIDPAAPEQPLPAAARPVPPVFDPSPHVAAFVAADKIKSRKPWTIPLFGVLTLGIYLIVWYYRINRELRDLGSICGKPGRELDVEPGRSALAVSLGAFLLVPPFVSVQRTLHRIQKAEQITDAPAPPLSTGKAWALFLLVLPFWTAYVQAHLNRIWQEQLRRAQPKPAAEVVEAIETVDSPTQEIPPPALSIEPWPVAPSEPVSPALASTPAPPAPPAPPSPVSEPLPPMPWPPLRPSAPPSPPVTPTPSSGPAPARPVRPSFPQPAPPPPVARPQRPPEPPPPFPRSPTPPLPPPLPPRPSVQAPLAAPPPPPPAAPSPPSSEPKPGPNIHDPAIEIIRVRYARGEITRQEYRDLLEDLA